MTERGQLKKQDVQQDFGDVANVYANNVAFETSIWDLTLLFGQLHHHAQVQNESGNAEIEWHTAVSIPWKQAKLMSFFLQLNLALYESAHGKINVPKDLLPPLPEAKDEHAEKINQLAAELVAKMFD